MGNFERDFVSLRGRSFNCIGTGSAEDARRTAEYFKVLPKRLDDLVADNADPDFAPSATALRTRFLAYLAAFRPVVDLSAKDGTVAAQAAYAARVDGLVREVSPMFTDLRIKRLAAGDLTVRVGAEGKSGFLLSIGEEVNRLIDTTGRAFGPFTDKAGSTAASVSEASVAIGQVSDGARHQDGQLAQVATALSQTSSAIDEVSGGTRVASDWDRPRFDSAGEWVGSARAR